MHRSKKRSRAAESDNMPGSFPDAQTPSKRRATAAAAASLSSSWLSSYLATPVRLVRNWLAGNTPNSAQQYKQASPHRHRSIEDEQVSALYETPTRKHHHQHRHRSNKQDAPTQTVSPVKRHSATRRARRRKSLVSRAQQQYTRRDRSNGLVIEYTSSKNRYYNDSASQLSAVGGYATPDRRRNVTPTRSICTDRSASNWSLLSKDSEGEGLFDDADSTLSIDSSLHDHGYYVGKRIPAKRYSVGGNAASKTAVALSEGSYSPSQTNRSSRLLMDEKRRRADVWIVRIRKKIEDTLAKTTPASRIATPVYDRMVKEDGDFDRRLDAIKLKMSFTLPKGARAVIEGAMSRGFTAEINSVPVGDRDIATLGDGRWLNDEVINFYMQLIVSRSEQNPALPKVHAFNTFFYSKLKEQGYASVRRWTRRIRLFEKDVLIVPVHLGVHWCCAVVDFKAKSIAYYDSLLGDNFKCLRLLMDYLRNESKDKLGKDFDGSGWTLRCDKGIPRQQNGYDCGVFSATFAEYASRNAPFTFSQSNCLYLRRKMIYEIATKSLMSMVV